MWQLARFLDAGRQHSADHDALNVRLLEVTSAFGRSRSSTRTLKSEGFGSGREPERGSGRVIRPLVELQLEVMPRSAPSLVTVDDRSEPPP
jgi:hypothetical protein